MSPVWRQFRRHGLLLGGKVGEKNRGGIFFCFVFYVHDDCMVPDLEMEAAGGIHCGGHGIIVLRREAPGAVVRRRVRTVRA